MKGRTKTNIIWWQPSGGYLPDAFQLVPTASRHVREERTFVERYRPYGLCRVGDEFHQPFLQRVEGIAGVDFLEARRSPQEAFLLHQPADHPGLPACKTQDQLKPGKGARPPFLFLRSNLAEMLHLTLLFHHNLALRILFSPVLAKPGARRIRRELLSKGIIIPRDCPLGERRIRRDSGPTPGEMFYGRCERLYREGPARVLR